MGLANLSMLLFVGVAWLATVRLIFGRPASQGDDLMQRGMTIAGWLMVLVGIVGVLAVFTGAAALAPWLLVIAVVIMAVGRYRHSERRALLWALGLAAERGIPLEQAAHAFAHERRDETGLRAARLAAELSAGAPLPAALRRSGNPLPFNARLACGVGWQAGCLHRALRRVVEEHEEFDREFRHAIEKFVYVALLLAAFCWSLTFLFARTVPAMSAVYADFTVDLPPMTEALFAFGDAFVLKWYWVYFIPVYMLVFVALAASILYYIGWLTWEPWLVRRLWRRLHTAWILRTLAFTVKQGQPLDMGMRLLSANYPSTYIAQQLFAATGLMAAGHPWWEALRKKGLIRAADAAVLHAAERAGNLAWALEEMSDSNLRRLGFRFRSLMSLVFPAVTLICGGLLFVLVISLLQPLATGLMEIASF